MGTINVGEDIVTRTFEPDSFDSLLKDLTKEIEVHNYRITRIYDIDNIFEQTERAVSYNIPFERYKIVEFCNLGSCVELISKELLAGVFMPLRFIVYQEEGATSHQSRSSNRVPLPARSIPRRSAKWRCSVLEGDMTDVLDEMVF